MAITDFQELRGLHGTINDAASTCLVRYFQLLRATKTQLRPMFAPEDLNELTEAVRLAYKTGVVPSDIHAVVARIAEHVSSPVAAKLTKLSPVEQLAFVDAVERTANLSKRLAREGQFIL